MELSFLFINKNAVKKPRRLYDNVFFYIEGGHLFKVNWLMQTLIRINQKLCKAI
jgi:hypothetical protein